MWNGSTAHGSGEDRPPRPPRVGGRVLWVLWLALAGAAGCGGAGEDPASAVPVLPPPRPSPPPPPTTDTLFLGFARDRIEIVEGEEVAVDIEFEAYYRVPPDISLWKDLWALDVRAALEAGSASAEDLVVGGVRIGYSDRILEAGTTWLAMRAPADGVAEGPETLRLRLEPAPNWHLGEYLYPQVIEVTNAELEVVIRDAEDPDVCPDIRITATAPRRVRGTYRGLICPFNWSFETEVTVESERGTALQLDRLASEGWIQEWRVKPLGSRIRHELLVQWKVLEERSWEVRVAPCPGRGPTLVCSWKSCRTYAPGSLVPGPRRPAPQPLAACR